MNSFNIIDIIAAVTVIAAITLGYYRGFIVQLVSVAGLFAAYLAAYWLYDDVSPIIALIVPLDQFQFYGKYASFLEGMNWHVYFYNAIAFAVVFFAVKVGFSIAGRLLHLIAVIPGLKTLNKWSGALLALFEAVVLLAIAVHVMIAIPSERLQKTLSSSTAAAIIVEQTPELANKLREMWSKQLK